MIVAVVRQAYHVALVIVEVGGKVQVAPPAISRDRTLEEVPCATFFRLAAVDYLE